MSRNSRKNTRGRSSSTRRSRSKQSNDFAFTRIGSMYPAKSYVENSENADELMDDLRDDKAKLWLKVRLPKGVNSVNFKDDDRILLSFQHLEDGPEWVLGSASMENEDDE